MFQLTVLKLADVIKAEYGVVILRAAINWLNRTRSTVHKSRTWVINWPRLKRPHLESSSSTKGEWSQRSSNQN